MTKHARLGNRLIAITIRILIALCFPMLVAGCHQESQHTASQAIYTVKPAPWQQRLYFSGTTTPLVTYPLISPVEGNIINMTTPPGQLVKKGQPLYLIKTDMAEKNFQPALTDYLKAKKALIDATQNQLDSKFLYKEKIIARQTYDKSEEDYYTAKLTAIQAKQKFDQTVSDLNIAQRNPALLNKIHQLTLNMPDHIQQVLEAVSKMDQFTLYSPVQGLLLITTSSNSSDDNKSGNKGVGSSVKKGELLGRIGTTDGIQITIKIDEADINKLHVGQSATITMDTLPGVVLNGKLTRIAMQATTEGNNAQFSAITTVSSLSPELKRQLHFGVDANVTLNIDGKPAIFVPIDAVSEHLGQTTVEKVLPNGQTETTQVTIGTSLETRIMITRGLRPGDKIVIPTH